MILSNKNIIERINNIITPESCDSYFDNYGGKALGIEIMKRLNISNVVVPDSIVLKYNKDTLTRDLLDLIQNREPGKKYTLKLSTLSDDFSEQAIRGKNSSIKNPKIELMSTEVNTIVEFINFQHVKDLKSIIFQEYVENSIPIGFIAHLTNDENVVEVHNNINTFLFSFNSENNITHSESTLNDRSVSLLKETVNIIKVIETLNKVRFRLGWNCNIEGIIKNDQLVVLQIRAIPLDYLVDSDQTETINLLDVTKYSNISLTKFVYGSFDISGLGIFIDDENRIMQMTDVIIFNNSNTVAWEREWIIKRLTDATYQQFQTVIVNFTKGCHLSHASECMPPNGRLRNCFKQVFLPWLKPGLLFNKKIRLISNGKISLCCYIDENFNDKKRTVDIKGRKVNFIQLEPSFIPPFDKITSVAVVPFTADGLIVATVLSRGIDIPGGHVLKTENSIEQVARREAMEEAAVSLKEIVVAKIIQSDYYGSTPETLTYMIVTAAFVDNILKFTENEEALGREILSPEKFLEKYIAGERDDMKNLIESAKEVLNIQ